LQEYTLTDKGTYLTLQSQNKSITDMVVIYKQGGDIDPADPLLNPASVLLGAKVCPDSRELASAFMDWMVSADGGQLVVKNYKQPGVNDVLYSPAPNCTTHPLNCAGW
jgi:ABC-type tungstate transport system permease subunit